MYSLANRRGHHRKRISALRLSSDSTVTTLPLYTSQRPSELPDIPLEQPPAYSDSAEEADEEFDTSDSLPVVAYVPSTPPSLPVSPRRARRSQGSTRAQRRHQIPVSESDPYLDSLLERSVHALEMSNALLQSSMSTQTSLAAVLADDAVVDRHLEERAEKLRSHIRSNRDMQQSWMMDLDEISRGVEGLVRDDDSSDEEGSSSQASAPISQSLPSSGLADRMQRRQEREPRPSQRFRQHHSSSSTTNLQLSVHERSHFVSPPPRAITMYIDSSEAADLIALPATMGVRPTSRLPPTPLPARTARSTASPEPEATQPVEHSRVVDLLAPYRSPSLSSSPPSTRSRRRSFSSSGNTVKKPRVSKSPPPPIYVEAPSRSSSSFRSRSLTPTHGSPALRQLRPLTPPIEELSTSSTSSDSATLHVGRTVESLRQILQKQRSASQSSGKVRSSSSQSAPPVPRPSFLTPPTVAPVSSTSNATASISRLFTKSRHTTSSRAASPPKQSSMKNRSAPPTPTTIVPAMPSPSPTLLSVPDLLGLGARSRSGGSSGASTPKRISFAEPQESYSSSKPEGSSSKFRAAKSRSKPKSGKERGRDAKGKGKGKSNEKDGGSDEERGGWWTGWLLGATGAGAESASGLGVGGAGHARSEERYAYASARSAVGGTWAMRPGFGGALDEWGA